jgi:predicted MFS family arabinose efflux permease
MAGVGISAWAITVPFTKIRFALNDATLGLILLAPGFGGILAMPVAGFLVGRLGSKTVLLGAGLVFGLVLPSLTIAPSVPAFTILLFIYGVMFAAIDIAMNAQAVVLENRCGRLLMSSFHALYSIGTLAVAVATSLLLRLGLSNAVCALLCGAGVFAIVSQYRLLLPKVDDLPAEGTPFALPNRKTLLLGLCCFACFLTEGAVTDWSTIFFRFSRGVNISAAIFGYAGFAVMMMLSRLAGDRLAMRLGQARVMRLGSLLAGLGMLLAVLCPLMAADVLGFAMVGLGIGNIAPLVFSAAARVPGMSPTTSTPAVVSLGYAGFLIGPVVIGLVANALGLSFALGLVAAMLFVLSFAARAVAPAAGGLIPGRSTTTLVKS